MDPNIAKSRQIIGAIIACIGGFIVGTVIGWSSPMKMLLECTDKNTEKCLTPDQMGWVISVAAIGAAISNALIGIPANAIGRRATILSLCGPLFLSYLALFLAKTHFIPLLIARFFIGFFGCAFCGVVPIYVAEITSTQMRGALGCCFQLLLVLGITSCWALGFSKSADVINEFCMTMPVFFALGMYVLPESPVYSIMKGNLAMAQKSMKIFRGNNYDTTNELRDISTEVTESEVKKASGVVKKFFLKSALKALAMCALLHVAQQLSGVNVIMFYLHHLIVMSGIDWNEYLIGVISGLVQFVAIIPSLILVDRVGRKPLLLISFTIIIFCLTLEGVYFRFYKDNTQEGDFLTVLPIAGIFLYLIGFSLGAGPLPWAVMSEFFSSDVRDIAVAFCSFINWMLVFGVGKSFEPLNNLLGLSGVFFMYAVLSTIAVILISMWVIETKNKTLTEIQKKLQGTQGVIGSVVNSLNRMVP